MSPTQPESSEVVNSARTSFTYTSPEENDERKPNKKTSFVSVGTAASQGEENFLEKVASQGEDNFERYGGDDVHEPPPKIEIAGTVIAALPPPTPVREPEMVTWDGPSDPANPQNWSDTRKWVVTITAIIMTVNVYVFSFYLYEIFGLFIFFSVRLLRRPHLQLRAK